MSYVLNIEQVRNKVKVCKCLVSQPETSCITTRDLENGGGGYMGLCLIETDSISSKCHNIGKNVLILKGGMMFKFCFLIIKPLRGKQ